MANDRPDLLSRKEVAHALGISEWMVRKMVKRKELPKGKKMGDKLVKWFRRDIDDYLNRLRYLGEDASDDDEDDEEDG